MRPCVRSHAGERAKTMSHYEERLEKDLARIRRRVAEVGAQIERALKDAVHATLALDRELAYRIVLGDLQINTNSLPPRQTTLVEAGVNLDARAAVATGKRPQPLIPPILPLHRTRLRRPGSR